MASQLVDLTKDDATAQPESRREQLKRKLAEATDEMVRAHKKMCSLRERLKEAEAEGEAAAQPSEEEKKRYLTLLLKLKNGTSKNYATEAEMEEFVSLVKKFGTTLTKRKGSLFRLDREDDCIIYNSDCVRVFFQLVAPLSAKKFQEEMEKKLSEHGNEAKEKWFASGDRDEYHGLTWVHETFVHAVKKAIDMLPFEGMEHLVCYVSNEDDDGKTDEDGSIILGTGEDAHIAVYPQNFYQFYEYGCDDPLSKAFEDRGYDLTLGTKDDINFRYRVTPSY